MKKLLFYSKILLFLTVFSLKTITAQRLSGFKFPEKSKNLTLEDNKKEDHSIARLWNEELLKAIRSDYARPTVHARNLFHVSVAMYDAWSVYNDVAKPYLVGNSVEGFKVELKDFISNEETDISIKKTISYAAYRLLKHRFKNSPNSEVTLLSINKLMESLGYDISIISTDYSKGNPAFLGNYIADNIIKFGLQDGSNEQNQYENLHYNPVNNPLVPNSPGNPLISNPNRWQPLSLEINIDQSGNITGEGTTDFLSPEWGNVVPFSLSDKKLTSYNRDSNTYNVYHDPGRPPYIGNDKNESDIYKWGFSLVSVWQSHLNSDDNVLWDISPKSLGNISLDDYPQNFEDYNKFYNLLEGGDISKGYDNNPITGEIYEEQYVSRGDYARVLAEFWADGPDSETPPGHWFTILNYVSDNPLLEKKFEGKGEIVSDLEWDLKTYFTLGAAMHDSAISAWSVKGWYDYIRPISAIRYMASQGQSTDVDLPNYNKNGINLIPNYIEVVTNSDPLYLENSSNLGKIKLYTWKGHNFIDNPDTDVAGVGWILAENWMPYQRPSFVTPPFAGYVSGHSTYSRAAAEIITLLTGSEFFPGGLGEFVAKKNEFLVFEEGPSKDIVLQWATYKDASDQCSLSRIWGGIHPPMDDIPGRIIGKKVGADVFNKAITYFKGNNNENTLEESKTIVYPNPIISNQEIKITNMNVHSSIQLLDLNGKEIKVVTYFNSISNTLFVSTANLASGFYFLKEGSSVWKVVIK
ncbi:DUF6851 domain-containing protein [Tenacibaculum salmonis]|uniref:DUF6851 domain-containing protein n=1 Tax=Tenacibaculum sp. P3-BQ1 TaxID=3232310 RepID=UPI0034DE98FB